MALVLAGVRLFTGGVDLTTRTNKVEFGVEYDEKDVTCWPDTDDDVLWKEVAAGLPAASLSAEGIQDDGTAVTVPVDQESWTALGGIGAVTVCPKWASVGSVAYVMSAMRGSYQLGGSVGDVSPWSAKLAGSSPLGRGRVLHAPGTARTANGSGAAVQLVPAIPTGKRLITNLHVLSVAATSGTPTLTVTVESDDTSGFASPTTRATFTASSVVGGQTLQVAGPIATDTYWRASWSIGGGATAPSFLFLVSFGIA